MDKSTTYERYLRQMQVTGFGKDAQAKLLHARVLIIGAGGLGVPVLQYLAGAGVSNIGIADNDTISLHNLHRQPIYTTQQIGTPKVLAAQQFINALNPDIQVITHQVHINNRNVVSIIQQYDIVVDGTDNFESRFLINDACVLCQKPIVYGALSQTEGQWAVWNVALPNDTRSANYRDLFSKIPPTESANNCVINGVIGVLPGIIGTLMAAEVIKLITQVGNVCYNQLMCYNMLNNQWYQFNLLPNSNNYVEIPATITALEQTEYANSESCNEAGDIREITGLQLESALRNTNWLMVDVRNEEELPKFTHQQYLSIPLQELNSHLHLLTNADQIVTICSAGLRSETAAEIIAEAFDYSKKVYNLKGGIYQWNESLKTFLYQEP